DPPPREIPALGRTPAVRSRAIQARAGRGRGQLRGRIRGRGQTGIPRLDRRRISAARPYGGRSGLGPEVRRGAALTSPSNFLKTNAFFLACRPGVARLMVCGKARKTIPLQQNPLTR